MSRDGSPSVKVRTVIQRYLERHNYLPDHVDVEFPIADNGDEMMLIKPRRPGAAEVLVRVHEVSSDDYEIYLFIAGSGAGIEIAGPLNDNHPPPHRSADEELLDYLDLIAGGSVGLVFDPGSRVPRVDLLPGGSHWTPFSSWA